jgi:hypothetical protein
VRILRHGGPLLVERLGSCPTPTTRQASGGDRHLKFYGDWDNLPESVQILRERGYEFAWAEFSKETLHLFADPAPTSPFGDYLILVPEARERLQQVAGLRIQHA